MPQSLAQIWLHVVFPTKDRRPFLRDDSFRTEMFRMLAYLAGELECRSVSVGGYYDHVHLLVSLPRTITVSDVVQHVKKNSSKWAKDVDGGSSFFAWQSGYGVFSVSHSKLKDVDKYIRNQESHHTKLSFQDEFRMLCRRHSIDIDERYVWA